MISIDTAPLVWHNGTIAPKEKLNLFFDVNLFLSTNLVETFFLQGTEVMFAHDTISRIKTLLSIYKFNTKLFNDNSGEYFLNETRRLLIRNNCYKTSRGFLLITEPLGNATPNEFIFIEPSPTLFGADKVLKQAIVSSKFLKPDGNVMSLPTMEHEFRKLVRAEFEYESADDCIILNQNQCITESYNGNIFLIDGNRAYTPSAGTGCTIHLLRGVIIGLLQDMGIELTESEDLPVDLLFEVREVIIAGTSGIFSLKGLEYKRYFDITRKKLTERLLALSLT
ncbi:MAG TPA: aminotransferase class IV [Prolixibacteraceae bacterium]|mgnify:CR=1 FL=1|nr:aminotransferase class IV [Prolixibacteraceae bacterium]